jgi:hypothetical protein
VRERRLDVLRELAENLTGSPFVVTVQQQVELRLSMFPNDEFKMCRDVFGINGLAAYQALDDSVETPEASTSSKPGCQTGETFRHARQEALDAIAKKLSERSG